MRKSFLTGLGAIALAALAGAATAQVPAAQAPTIGAAPSPARHAADRPITRAQFVDARVARLTALDADRDGAVSVEERRAAIQAKRAEHANDRFAKLDADGDGSISRAEFDAGHAVRPERGPRGERAGHRAGLRHAMPGQGGSGRKGRERGPVTISEVAARLGERFDRLDADRDGVITADERRAAMTARRAERQAARPAPQVASPAPASE